MYSTLLTVALFFTFAINAVFADFAVSDPEINACQNNELKVTWQQAQAPYNLIIVAADDPCGDALVDGGDVDTTFATVKTNGLKAGQKVLISVEDANGDEGWSNEITVKDCSASSSSSLSSSSAGDPIAATTLVVTPTYTVGGSSSPSTSGAVDPVGAANAATFGNAAAVPRHLSIPALTLTAIAGVVALL